MPKIDPPPPPSVALFRFVALAVLFLSITAGGLAVLSAITAMQHPDANVATPTLFLPVILILITGIAVATLLEGISRLISAEPPPQGTDDTASQVNLMMTIAELQNSLPTLIGESVRKAVGQIKLPEPPVANPELNQHLERMVKLLEEMKELSMLDESQRQNRRQQTMLRRKGNRLDEVNLLIEQQSWAQADALLHLLESLHPGDADVQTCRQQLDNARILHQATEWEQLSRQTSDHLALSQYQPALTSVNRFLEKYPAHSEAVQLARQIRQEEAIQIETAAGRLYDQIKTAVENRQWRGALDGIQDFLDRYPENHRAEKIRKQIRVIQKNAEIEERHEQEDRIKELIDHQQFSEAAELSEDLLARFPDSPQAAYLSDLLPKLRERGAVSQNALSQS